MSEDTKHANPNSTSQDRVSLLWVRLKEHRIAQWGLGYVAVAYGIQHAVKLTSEAYDWPNIIVRLSMTLLALGLPIAITLAWYHGERASRGFSRAEFSILAVLLAIGAFLFYVFARPAQPVAPVGVVGLAYLAIVALAGVALLYAVLPQSAERRKGNLAQSAAAADSDAAGTTANISLAVLPFLNLSRDPEQEFFSDGMTEEITAALAQIKGLRVVGRTSAFSFKGQNKTLREVGEALGATHLIEGSVRKSGEQLRITAQLIRAADDNHLWAHNYNRDLRDVFAVQEEIAKAIAAELQVPLGLPPGEYLISNRTSDTAAYQDYLRALAIFRARDIGRVITVLEPMVKRDPNYAPAWALLALGYMFEPLYVITAAAQVDKPRARVQSALMKADEAVQKAVELDSRSPLGCTALGFLEAGRGHWVASDRQFEKALALDATDPDTLHIYSLILMCEGRLSHALALRNTLRQLDPFVPVYNLITALAMQLNGDMKGAIAILEPLPPSGTIGAQRDSFLALAYASMGQYQRAAETILTISPTQVFVSAAVCTPAADILRNAPRRILAPEPTEVSVTILSWVYAFVGAPERVVDGAQYQVTPGATVTSLDQIMLWHPALASVRKTEQFKALVRKIGLVDYWRAKGWPDLCHPTTGDDFACD